MEEKKGIQLVADSATPKTDTANEVNEQVQKIINQANQKIQYLVMQLNDAEILLRDKTIDQLFQVLKYHTEFSPEFVAKCAEAIETYLTNSALKKEVQEGSEVKNTDTPPTD